MAPKPESKFVGQLNERIFRKFNCLIFNIHGHMMQSTSWPDLYIVHKKLGQFWLEAKVYPNTIMKNVKQRQRINELRSRGAPVVVATLFDDFDKIPAECFRGHDFPDTPFVMLEYGNIYTMNSDLWSLNHIYMPFDKRFSHKDLWSWLQKSTVPDLCAG